jgi:hypothetical protein
MYYDNIIEPYKNQSNEDDKLQFVICDVNFLGAMKCWCERKR